MLLLLLPLLLPLGCGFRVHPPGSDVASDSGGSSDSSSDGGAGDSGPIVGAVDLRAAQVDAGNLVWADAALDAGLVLQALVGDEWVVLAKSGVRWVDPDSAPAYRVVDADGNLWGQAEPYPTSLRVGASDPTRLVGFGGTLDLTALLDVVAFDTLPVELWVTAADGQTLTVECADTETCWTTKPAALTEVDAATDTSIAVPTPGLRDSPGLTLVTVSLVLGDDGEVLRSVETSLRETARWDAWGDLHNHTGLSNDACEDLDRDCVSRLDLPATDTFALAIEHNLDFAAITDHAEFEVLTRSDLEKSWDIWGRGQEMVGKADLDGVIVPFIGYEWTGSYTDGGHRTVLFADTTVCKALRPAAQLQEVDDRDNGVESYSPDLSYLVAYPKELEAVLDAADATEGCDPTRAVSYFHHPAYRLPKRVDWTAKSNVGLRDTVVEIYSEHGSSECTSPTDENCDWAVNVEFYEGPGAVRNALDLGWRLGFVGGTDNHRGSPGSTDEGPSYTFTMEEPNQHLYVGGFTVALVGAATLSRDAVLDAIDNRQTMASSWRFDGVTVAAEGVDGVLYLPGDDVPASASPLVVVATLDHPDLGSTTIELLDPLGVVIDTNEGTTAELDLDLIASPVAYVRMRTSVDGAEQRLWASPFFLAE
jgi:hypothetical protein